MKFLARFFAFLLLTGGLSAAETFDQVKEKIAAYHSQLGKAESAHRESEIHYQLALAYFADQEIDQAFGHFLQALHSAPVLEKKTMNSEEEKWFNEAMTFYDGPSGKDPIKCAQAMIDQFEQKALAHEEYLHLNMLLGVAYANLEKYDLFFEKFYRSYPHLRDTFLAAKTEGILYLRLARHSKSPEEKHLFEEEAFRCLDQALERNPQDSNLYKVMIFFAQEKSNDQLVLSYLQKMIEADAPIARGDVYLYVREAVAMGDFSLGQKIIDKACQLYDYSRAVSAAQEYLNHTKDGK